MLKALILLGAAVWSGPCPNPAQQWLLSAQYGQDMMLKLRKPLQDRCFTAQHCWPCRETKGSWCLNAFSRLDGDMSTLRHLPTNVLTFPGSWGEIKNLCEHQHSGCSPDLDPIYMVLSHLCLLGRQHCTFRLEKLTFENKKLIFFFLKLV